MISKIYLTYNPVTGNLTKVETGESKLYQGQVGTVEYYVTLAEGYENEWRPSDTVLMVFQRPDNTKGTPRIMTAIEGGWKLVSDGWETDIEVVETSEISVNLWVRRYLPNGKNIDKTTQQVKLTVFPSNGYTPLNISNDVADQILEMLGDVQAEQLTQAADIINLTERVTENEGDITALQGRATQSETDISVLKNRVTNTETDITALQVQVANLSAEDIAYDNEFSGIQSTNVQGAIDELDVRVETNKEELDLAVSQISTLSAEKLDKVFTGLVEQTVINLTDTVAINRNGQAYKITLQRLVSGSAAELFIIVNELPEEGFPNKIYLVPTADPESTNRFDEYAYIDGQWEHFGSLTIDLSDYYTKTEINTLLSAYLAKNQGAENAGKVLGIDESGGVVPVNSSSTAENVTYDNTDSGLTATTVQGAIDETIGNIPTLHLQAGRPASFKSGDLWFKLSSTPPPVGSFLYGVKIAINNGNPDGRVEYTNDAYGFTPSRGNNGNFSAGSWDDTPLFGAIRPYLVKNSGAELVELDPNDYSKDSLGNAVDIETGLNGDVMIRIPKIYYSFTKDEENLYIKVSDTKRDETFTAWAHSYNGVEKNAFYVGAYKGCVIENRLRSLSGKSPAVSTSLASFRSYAQNNGTGYEQLSYNKLILLQILYLLRYKSTNSQSALGAGLTSVSSKANTGATNAFGMNYGTTSGSGRVKCNGIEDLWGNIYDYIDGLYITSTGDVLVADGNFSNATTGYETVLTGITNASGFMKTCVGTNKTGFMLETTGASDLTYYCDYGYVYRGGFPIFGGNWDVGASAGAFRLGVSNDGSGSNSVGGRLVLS